MWIAAHHSLAVTNHDLIGAIFGRGSIIMQQSSPALQTPCPKTLVTPLTRSGSDHRDRGTYVIGGLGVLAAAKLTSEPMCYQGAYWAANRLSVGERLDVEK
jgi:hypothetical protein